MAKNKLTVKDVEDAREDTDSLCLVARRLGYTNVVDQLLVGNGAAVSDLLAFFDDNPGAIGALYEWIIDNHDLKDPDESEDDEESDEEN